jgi:chromate reductase
MRVLGISGSLRRGSHNTHLLRAVADRLPPGLELVVYEELGELPPYDFDADVEPAPAPVQDLRDAIAAADAVVFSTPEYNGSIPGVLKNAVDWASRPFPDNALRNKPVLVVGASTGMFGAVWAQADLRKVLGLTGARVLGDQELAVPMAHEIVSADGSLSDPDLEERLVEHLAHLSAELAPAEAVALQRAA